MFNHRAACSISLTALPNSYSFYLADARGDGGSGSVISVLFFFGLAYGFLSLIVRTFVRGVRKNIFVNVTTDTRYTKDVRMSID